MSKTFLAKFLYVLFTYHNKSCVQDRTSPVNAISNLNADELSTEFEISRWSIDFAVSTTDVHRRIILKRIYEITHDISMWIYLTHWREFVNTVKKRSRSYKIGGIT